MNLFYQPGIPQGIHHLDVVESHHAVKVLRMRTGDSLKITDGQGQFYESRIEQADPGKCTFQILNARYIAPRKFSISLAIAPTKNMDRIEWFVEKAVEIGIEQIQFILCKNSERKSINLDRIQKIAVSALKQSGQCWLPKISDIKSFTESLHVTADQKFICYVDSSNPLHLKSLAEPNKNYWVLIGPEGDFRADELELAISNGFIKASLGPIRLRTETAALTASHTLNLINL